MADWKKNYLRYRSFFLNIYGVYQRRPDLKVFLEIFLSLGTISFFALLALRPTALTISQLLKDIDSKQETEGKMDEKIQNLQTAQSVYEQETANILVLKQAVPENPTPETFVRQLEGLTQNHSVNILGITVGEVVLVGEEDAKKGAKEELSALPQGAGELSFSISASGSYPNLSSFLSDLKILRRPIKIDRTTLTASETDEGITLVLVVSGRVPYLIE